MQKITILGLDIAKNVFQVHGIDASQRLESIPGIGVLGATAITALVPDPGVFRSGRDFAAWIGIVPRQESTGGEQRLGPISKTAGPLLASHPRRRGHINLARFNRADQSAELAMDPQYLTSLDGHPR